ncbi:MAG: phytanoyl-CoA dioxygenase family protein [Roseivirga sp.]|nr:phytanoyl-CoA dioxygenase family protein [Roseivirga sp.]
MNKEQFLKDGYLLFPKAIPQELLKKWQQLADNIESAALAAHALGDRMEKACVVEDKIGPRLMRFDELYLSHTQALLELLSIDTMQGIIKELSGPSSVVIYCDLLFKHQHPHPVIKWHQGSPHSRNYPYLNIGIYLDNANEDDGCLRYVPGTQDKLQPISDIEREHGWTPPGLVQQPAKVGDILVQDMMILHSSEPKRSPGARRTIYVEVRPIEGIIEQQKVSDTWLDSRKAFMATLLETNPGDYFSKEEKAFFGKPAQSSKELANLMGSDHLNPIPAVYSVMDIKGPGYPVPDDLL